MARLKIRDEHFDTIADAIDALARTNPPAWDAHLASDLSDKRKRWDAMWAARLGGDSSRWICDNLYDYLNDDHIDSALRKIMARY